jgi:hypothetical protein
VPPDPISEAIEAVRASGQRKPVFSAPSTTPAPPRVYLGSAYGRYLEPDHLQSLIRMLRYPVMFAPTWNDALLCRARSKTATHFLTETDYDVHVSIDSDIVFDPASVLQIAQQAHDTGGIVAGLYVTRAGGALCRPTSIFETDVPIEFGTDPTPVPVKWAATGFMATPRIVFETLARDMPLCHPNEFWKFFPLYMPLIVDGENGPEYLSEDFSLCERARRAGFQVYLNPAVRLLHLGQYPFSISDLGQPERTAQPVRMTYQTDHRYRFEVADTSAVTTAR